MDFQLQVFSNGEFNARTFTDDNGIIWVAAKDVARALGYSGSSIRCSSALMACVPECWKGIKPIYTLGGKQEMLCLSEQGVYFFLGRSDKPNALPYQMWIAGEVVPSIRKSGKYGIPSRGKKGHKRIMTLSEGEQDERLKVQALEAQREQDKPKVLFAESVEASKDSITLRELAELLRQNGYVVWENGLFAILREKGFLMKTCSDYNMPTPKSMDLGLMEIHEHSINRGEGEIITRRTLKITGKGQVYFVNYFLRGGEINNEDAISG